MWSDRIAPSALQALIAQLHSVVPRPSPDASNTTQILRGTNPPEHVANSLQHQSGFVCLKNTLLHNPLATISYDNGRAVICAQEKSLTLHAPAFDLLEAMLAAWHGPSNARLAGFLSYDLAQELEALPTQPPSFHFPQFYFGLYDSALTFDDHTWTLSATNSWRKPCSKQSAEDLLQNAAPSPPPIGHRQPAVRSQPDGGAFQAAVQRIVATIHAGDIFQTNLCRCIETNIESGGDWPLFQHLRAISPAKYEAFVRINGGQSVFSITPEQFLKVAGRLVESSPIKGTRPRSTHPDDDAAYIHDLQTSEKDLAELAMIVDVVRNDLSRVCQTGSVEVAAHSQLMTLPTVHHLYSTVRGRLRDDANLVDLLRAAFPAASITGAPKIEAMRVASREEQQQRGPCMGAIGSITLDGQMELSVAIRTAFVTDDKVRYYAGCGITADSVPSTEYEESEYKAAAFLRALAL